MATKTVNVLQNNRIIGTTTITQENGIALDYIESLSLTEGGTIKINYIAMTSEDLQVLNADLEENKVIISYKITASVTSAVITEISQHHKKRKKNGLKPVIGFGRG